MHRIWMFRFFDIHPADPNRSCCTLNDNEFATWNAWFWCCFCRCRQGRNIMVGFDIVCALEQLAQRRRVQRVLDIFEHLWHGCKVSACLVGVCWGMLQKTSSRSGNTWKQGHHWKAKRVFVPQLSSEYIRVKYLNSHSIWINLIRF